MENNEHNTVEPTSIPESQEPVSEPVPQPVQQPEQPPVQPVQPMQQPVQQPVQQPMQQPLRQTYCPPVPPIQQHPQQPTTGAFYYRPWQQPVQQPVQPPVQQPVQPPVQPQQPQMQPHTPSPVSSASRPGMRAVSILVALAVLIGGCVLTALLMNRHWEKKLQLIRQNTDEKLAAMQQLLEENQNSTGGSGGQLATPGEALTAAEIFRRNADSVVAITCTTRVTEGDKTYESGSAGTGFVLTEDGYVVTNHHVIDGATFITVTMYDGTAYSATLVGSDATNDIALIKVAASGLQPAVIGSSSDLVVGDQVVAIGNALGELSTSLTVGYVSGMDRDISTDGTIINMLQTDVAINSGNSGGPLFNAKGEVIGITTAKYSGTTSSGASIEGISFAIPINDVIGMLEDLRQYGYIRSAYLGVMVRDMDPAVIEAYGFPAGVYVDSVTMGSCAMEAGIRSKDIIVELGGYKIENLGDLSRALRQFEAGQSATVVVWRAGQEHVLNIVFDEKPRG